MPRVLIGALVLAGAMLSPGAAPAQTPVDWDQLGAWYMLFWSTRFDDTPLGLQGDVQHRNWNPGTDLEQLLIRGGLTYALPESPVLVTGGGAHITSGAFGDSDETSAERRVYQEALVRHSLDGSFLCATATGTNSVGSTARTSGHGFATPCSAMSR